jgi:hypothetical protein
MTLQRLEHQGAAPVTGLASSINASATALTLVSGAGYPTGAVGPFVLAIDPGTGSEEKVLCSSRSGTAVVVTTRGYDGTTATSHTSGTSNIAHVWTATEADDTNAHIYTTSRDDHTQYVRADGGRAYPGITLNSTTGVFTTASGATRSTLDDGSGNMSVGGTFAAGTLGGGGASNATGGYVYWSPNSGYYGLHIHSNWGNVAAGNPLQISNSAGTLVSVDSFGVMTAKAIALSNATTATTVTGGGSASPLPANPVGYVEVPINGTTFKIPYYNV